MGPPNTQPHPKKRFKHKFHQRHAFRDGDKFQGGDRGGDKGPPRPHRAHATQSHLEVVPIDFAGLPADLTAAESVLPARLMASTSRLTVS